ncbi:MAG: riboflavin kinase [Candidatus Borkfalkia sp.]
MSCGGRRRKTESTIGRPLFRCGQSFHGGTARLKAYFPPQTCTFQTKNFRPQGVRGERADRGESSAVSRTTARVRPSATSGWFWNRYKGDLYGEEIVVYFDGRLRDIRKFESADALKAQLKIDLEKIR